MLLILCLRGFLLLLGGLTVWAVHPVVLFQAVDESFLSLWLNWWAIAHRLNVIPSHWELHVACIGDSKLAQIVARFHQPGCSQLLSKESYKKRIYFAKWTAITEAVRMGKDLLVVDLDAVMIRDPRPVLKIQNDSPSKFDIISSRDHGPAELPFATLWGTGRFCTGFIFLKYSKKVKELVEFSNERCDKYGHDQIQFNNALSRSALAWNELPEKLDSDEKFHDGYIAWVHQRDPDFVLFRNSLDDNLWRSHHAFAEAVKSVLLQRRPSSSVSLNEGVPINRRLLRSSIDLNDTTRRYFSNDINILIERKRKQPQKAVQANKYTVKASKREYEDRMRNNAELTERIDVRLLDRWSVLRYCNEAQKPESAWITFLDIAEISREDIQKIVALHCFVETGPIGEQGVAKKTVKEDVMEALNFWILGGHFRSYKKEEFTIPGYEGEVGFFNDSKASSTSAFLEYFVHKPSLDRMIEVWINGNLTAHKNTLS